jgi:N-acetylglutamate synthase-like GNAT family acetyltransferase
MRFIVSFEGERRFVNLVFGAPMDIRQLLHWRTGAAMRGDPQVRDAMEFRKLATKRWRYYLKGNEAATDLRALKRAIRTNPAAEVGFLLIAKASWHSAIPVMACCFCRRSWCHQLIVDFLAVHPKVLAGANGRVRGVGTRMIYSLVGLADALGIATIWGEATKSSAAFYQKVLNLPKVSDHFFVRDETMEHCRQQNRRAN